MILSVMDKRTPILIMFGGVSAEHEVSIITGLQVVEALDYDLYEPYVIYVRRNGVFCYLPRLTHRSQFLKVKALPCVLGVDDRGAYFKTERILSKKIYVDVAYLAFHGGNGEGGAIQGMLESLRIPFTSADHEGSAIAMNKVLAKQVLKDKNISVVEGYQVFKADFLSNSDQLSSSLEGYLGYPMIIKPAHLGSSIGIQIARDRDALFTHLSAALQMDNEILIEKFMEGFVEYNVSVRVVDHHIICSEIERPRATDEILSFADKYQREGSKKQQRNIGGMANLARELPAKISPTLAERIRDTARRVFVACRLGGVVRIDMMYVPASDQLFVNEINPIPGSMSFYLWEASGVPFRTQITESLEQALRDGEERQSFNLEYDTDVVEKFIQTA